MEKIKKKPEQQIHVLTLVIRRQKDIPLVRLKAKMLAQISGFNKVKRAQIALLASELARNILKKTKHGIASFFIVCNPKESDGSLGTGILLEFRSRSAKPIFLLKDSEDQAQLMVLQKAPDSFEVKDEKGSVTLVRAIFWGGKKTCEEFEKSHDLIKQRLFSDVEESYLENLRAKHEEVLELLKTISLKNKELDKVNAELLELSKDMESLVHERTVVELALRIADKVRNPATVIGGLSSILLKKMPKDSKWRPKIEAIFSEAKKLEEIVKDFEGLAKAQENFFTELDLRELVKELVQAWQPSFDKKNIRLKLNISDEPLKIHGNPRTLKVALLHIFKNAIDASIDGSIIEISVARINGRPTVEVRDYGMGIEENIKNKLFKELVTTKPSGTGVGLIMVHHIMNEHQGKIDIDSKPGLGTTVRLVFPIRWKEQ